MATTTRRAVIITALPIERTAVLEHLQDYREESHALGSVYRRGVFKEDSEPWDILVAEIGAGNEGAAAETERALAYFSPQAAVFVGVAGAIKDLTHGDVVASTKIYGYASGKDTSSQFLPRPAVELSGYALSARARHEAGEKNWLRRIRRVQQIDDAGLVPTAKVGPIAAGPLVVASKRSATYEFLRKQYGDALAVEMEGHGFLLAVHMNHPVMGIVVRGISDRISGKNPASDDDWQPIAARHAAAFAFQILARLPHEAGGATHPLSAGAAPQQVIRGDPFDGNSEIDLAAERLRQGEPDVAIFQLSSLRKRRWHSLTARERYRLVANLGHAEERMGRRKEAARHYIEAKGYQPEDETACSLEAVGYFLLGEDVRADELAAAVMAKHPTSSMATAVRIRCAPEGTPLTDLERLVPPALRNDFGIQHALSWRASNAGDMATAERLAREGKRSSPDSVELQEQLGALIVQAESRVRRDGAAPSTLRLEEAISALSFALSRAKGQKDIARLRYTRAAAYDLLDQSDMAETDFRAACENDKDDAEIAFRFAVFLERLDRHDDAIDILQRIPKNDGLPKPRLLLANLLAERNRPGDHAKAMGILEAAVPATVSADAETRAGVAAMLTRLYGVLGNHDDALRALDALPPGYLSDAVRLSLRADALSRSGRKDDARGLASQAKAALEPNSHDQDKLRVAQSLYSLDEHRLAWSIWKPLLKPTRDEPFKEMALDCARKVDDDQFIIRYCRQLRSNGIYQPFCLELEAVTLERYSCYDAAVALMQEYLQSPADEGLARVFRVRLSLIGLRLRRPDLVESNPGELPPPSVKPVAVGYSTACVLKHGPRPEEGVKYAYELVRNHFSEPEAREVYLAAIGMGDEMMVSFPDPTTACPGSAVRYRIEDSGEKK